MKILIHFIFFSLLFVCAWVDYKKRIIPDGIVWIGLVSGLLLSLLFPEIQHSSSSGYAILKSFLGVLVGIAFLVGIRTIGKVCFKKEILGRGDVKFLGMIGAFLGGVYVLLCPLLAAFLALPFALYIRNKHKKLTPFGPFLALSAFFLYLIRTSL